MRLTIDQARVVLSVHGMMIIAATRYTSKSIADISSLFNVPIVSCHRCVKLLLDYGFLEVDDKCVGERGRSRTLYKSTVRDLKVFRNENNRVITVPLEIVIEG